jgi:hypothetical protein
VNYNDIQAHNGAAGNHDGACAHYRRTNEGVIFYDQALGVRTDYASDACRKKKCGEKARSHAFLRTAPLAIYANVARRFEAFQIK